MKKGRKKIFVLSAVIIVAAAAIFVRNALTAVSGAREAAVRSACGDAVARAVSDGIEGVTAEAASGDKLVLASFSANISCLAADYFMTAARRGTHVRLGAFTGIKALSLAGPAIGLALSGDCEVSCSLEWRRRYSCNMLYAEVCCRVYPGGLSSASVLLNYSIPVLAQNLQ